MRLIVAVLVLSFGSWALAEEAEVHAAPDHATAVVGEISHAGESHAGPVLPDDTRWAGVMVIVIVGLFVMAAAVGVTVRVNAPEEVPPAHSHDEPPGASHHHGSSGLVNPEPGHGGHH